MTDWSGKIGHAHLKVRDLARAVAFYEGALNLRVNDRYAHYVFLTGTGMHHEIALQEVGPGAPEPARTAVGLFHVAFELPDQRSLALAVRHLRQMGVRVAVVEHAGISWAAYFSDPDGNGLELYWDTRRAPGDKWQGDLDRPIDDAELYAVLDDA